MRKFQADGDDYWFLFNSIRARLNDLYQYRQSSGDKWGNITFETFAFKFRMFLEEFSFFIRAALIERGQLTTKEIKAYGPKSILEGVEAEVMGLRFITAKSLRKQYHSDGEFSLPFEYEDFIVPNLEVMDALYGKLGNFTHPSLKSGREEFASMVVGECFEFFKTHQAIFRRHTLEKFSADHHAPPTDLDGLLFIVGQTDDGSDVFFRCEGKHWVDRTPTITIPELRNYGDSALN